MTGKVVRELHRRIADGVLRPGDRLPSRGALSEKLGVSEFVVRRAFAEFAADRLIA
ncbi:MAG: GntR family transcriptional regulator [Kiritimatiellae bacterium]|nr:GntR family transcriptional regulator [Kiritimatiellia bacterium]